MWITLLVMAVAVSLEPFRIGMSVVMLNRPRPHLQLAAFLCGGFLMGLSVGAVVLFFLESRLPAWASAHFNLPTVQIVIGVLALVAAVLLAVTKGKDRELPAWLSRLLDGRSLWVAGVAGLGIALPSVDYLAALAVIAAANLEAGVRMGALVTFNVVAFSLVEIPLLAYLIAPQRTRTAMSNLHNWIRARQRHEVAGLLAVVGVVLVAAGALGI
ncbi:hypothetical protein MTY66_01140 [Mycolicibacterium sp. TY66]|uniref:GAP family protein n=1 Tax=unclassified Mycolicibacterium TaxID=2636767 RepID=UPI001BB3934B|nr:MULTISPECIES: GAP family protein [unclassified Mycolicibacterium]BCI78489.1 hypothetical protein MTY66_01140 [Mycolicibacterium sp. TY66]BCJ83848.1 hypothetical protein MTY81_52210 [Mycolicibacterium sp. TY81]